MRLAIKCDLEVTDSVSDSISVYMPVYRTPRAVFEALKSFRTFYKTAPITVLSDNGDDFTKICAAFNARYIHADRRVVIGPEDVRTSAQSNLEGIKEILARVYRHCVSTDTDWVIWLEADVRTIRQIRSFPSTDAAGCRMNPFSPELTDYLVRNFGDRPYGYGMAGGSIFRRSAFIDAYESIEIGDFVKYDERVAVYFDIAFTLILLVSGYTYSQWEEISEIFHPISPIVRDAAFDHAYKYWYDKGFDEKLLNELTSF